MEPDQYIDILRLFSAVKHIQLTRTLPTMDVISDTTASTSMTEEHAAVLRSHGFTELMVRYVDAVVYGPVLGMKVSVLKKISDEVGEAQRGQAFLMPFEG